MHKVATRNQLWGWGLPGSYSYSSVVSFHIKHVLAACYHVLLPLAMCWLLNELKVQEFSLTWYNHCLTRLSSFILHCAAVCPHNDTLIKGWVNGKHCLVGTSKRINYSLGLLVSSTESYHNPIPPPGDSGSRSTSGNTGEGPGLLIVS